MYCLHEWIKIKQNITYYILFIYRFINNQIIILNKEIEKNEEKGESFKKEFENFTDDFKKFNKQDQEFEYKLKKLKEKFDHEDYLRLHEGQKSDPDFGTALLDSLISISQSDLQNILKVTILRWSRIC